MQTKIACMLLTVITALALLFTLTACIYHETIATAINEPDDNPGVTATPGIHKPVDLGGRTLTIASQFDMPMPFTHIARNEEPDPATSTAIGYIRDRLIWDNHIRVLEEFNINLEFRRETYLEELLLVHILAGTPFADSIYMNGRQMLSAMIGDLILPLSVIDLPYSDILGQQVYGRKLQPVFGEYWAWEPATFSPNIWMLGVNMDIIDAISAPSPIDLFNNGQWTWEAALEIMRLSTRDTVGDGHITQWGIAGQPTDIFAHFIAANDGYFVIPRDDFFANELLSVAMDHPRTIEALEFLEIIFREGLWRYCRITGPDVNDWSTNAWAHQQ